MSADRVAGVGEAKVYLCWCDGSACSGVTDRAFWICAECRELGHRPLPRPEGASDELVEVTR